jgi:hypothetical protein
VGCRCRRWDSVENSVLGRYGYGGRVDLSACKPCGEEAMAMPSASAPGAPDAGKAVLAPVHVFMNPSVALSGGEVSLLNCRSDPAPVPYERIRGNSAVPASTVGPAAASCR